MRRLILVGFLALAAFEANAQCKADVDCKGDRICVRSECVEPAGKVARVVPFDRSDPGWARTGGTVALVGAAATLALAIVAESMTANHEDGTGVGAAAVAVAIPSALVAAFGSSSVRGADGSPALRVVGWIAFGVALVDAAYLITLGLNDVRAPTGAAVSTGVLGALGIGCLSADAFIRAGEADDAARRLATGDGPRLIPIADRATRRASGLGLALRF
ncbi:MAG: hypothetical protein LC689_22020 [Myxococcales bacterium]|nr:hypothetical protein [Myxococcales bacterium]